MEKICALQLEFEVFGYNGKFILFDKSTNRNVGVKERFSYKLQKY